MTLRLQNWRDVLLAFAAQRTGFRWEMQDEKGETYNSYPRGLLSGPTNVVNPGTDWVVFTASPTPPHMLNPEVCGVRSIDMFFKVISDRQTSAYKAQGYLEKLRMAMMLPNVQEAFDVLGLAMAGPAGPIMDVPAPFGNKSRTDSISVMQVRFNCTPSALVETEGDSSRIDQILLSSELLGLTDEPIPSVLP